MKQYNLISINNNVTVVNSFSEAIEAYNNVTDIIKVTNMNGKVLRRRNAAAPAPAAPAAPAPAAPAAAAPAPKFINIKSAAKSIANWHNSIAGLLHIVANSINANGVNSIEFKEIAIAYLMDVNAAIIQPIGGETRTSAEYKRRLRTIASHDFMTRSANDELLTNIMLALASKRRMFAMFRNYGISYYTNDNSLIIATRRVIAFDVKNMTDSEINAYREKNNYIETDVTLSNNVTKRYFVRKNIGRITIERLLRETRRQRRTSFAAIETNTIAWESESGNIITLVERTRANMIDLAPFVARSVYATINANRNIDEQLYFDSSQLDADDAETYDTYDVAATRRRNAAAPAPAAPAAAAPAPAAPAPAAPAPAAPAAAAPAPAAPAPAAPVAMLGYCI